MKTKILLLLLFIITLSACNTKAKENEKPKYTIEYKFYNEGYYSVSKIIENKEIGETLIIEIPEVYDDGIHGTFPVYSIEGHAISGYINELILPESIKRIETYAFNHFQPGKLNLEYIEYIGDFAFNNLQLDYDLHLDNLKYAGDYAFVIDRCWSDFFDFHKQINEHKIYIGKNSNPNIAIDALPYNVVLYENFTPRLAEVLLNFNSYNSENIYEISYLEYLGTQEIFLEKCKDLKATFIFTNCKFKE